MPHIRLDDKEIELSVGELRIGTGDEVGVRIDSVEAQGDFAIISVDPRGTATVRRAATGPTILVNGVALGAEPAPLLHGDRIEVAGRQLRFSDDRKAGSTVLMPAFGAPSSAVPATNRARAAATGGRVVSLVDGREYGVPKSGLRIGRDAGCDIVVPGEAVSRQHAEISVTSAGYFVRDLSSNGVFVNGARTGDAQLLRRGDVIRVGTEEFRFYADAADGRKTAGTRMDDEARFESNAAVRFGGEQAIFSQTRPVKSRPDSASKSLEPTRGRSALVWLAAAVVIGATLLFVIQDR